MNPQSTLILKVEIKKKINFKKKFKSIDLTRNLGYKTIISYGKKKKYEVQLSINPILKY
jgi:hypothetical protein